MYNREILYVIAVLIAIAIVYLAIIVHKITVVSKELRDIAMTGYAIESRLVDIVAKVVSIDNQMFTICQINGIRLKKIYDNTYGRLRNDK